MRSTRNPALPRLKISVPTRAEASPSGGRSTSERSGDPSGPPLGPPADLGAKKRHLAEALEQAGLPTSQSTTAADLLVRKGPAWKRTALETDRPQLLSTRGLGDVMVTRKGEIALSTGKPLGQGAQSKVMGSALVDLETDGRCRVTSAALLIRQASNPEELERELLVRERLSDATEHVVPLIDAVIRGEAPVFTRYMLEPAYQPNLRLRLMSNPPLSRGQIDALSLDMMAGVAALHARNVLHNDLQLDNALTRTDSTGRLAVDVGDLGFAVVAETPRSVECSLEYVAPELAEALLLRPLEEPERTKAQDAYALGRMLYALHHGEYPPFHEEGLSYIPALLARAALLQTKDVEPRDFSTRDCIILALLAPHPEKRLSAEKARRLYLDAIERAPAPE